MKTLYVVENHNHLPDGGMFGPTYLRHYVIAADSEKEARQLAVERSGQASWEYKLNTSCKKVGTSDSKKSRIVSPEKQHGVY